MFLLRAKNLCLVEKTYLIKFSNFVSEYIARVLLHVILRTSDSGNWESQCIVSYILKKIKVGQMLPSSYEP